MPGDFSYYAFQEYMNGGLITIPANAKEVRQVTVSFPWREDDKSVSRMEMACDFLALQSKGMLIVTGPEMGINVHVGYLALSKQQPKCMINPRLVDVSTTTTTCKLYEGAQKKIQVISPDRIKIEWMDTRKKKYEKVFEHQEACLIRKLLVDCGLW